MSEVVEAITGMSEGAWFASMWCVLLRVGPTLAALARWVPSASALTSAAVVLALVFAGHAGVDGMPSFATCATELAFGGMAAIACVTPILAAEHAGLISDHAVLSGTGPISRGLPAFVLASLGAGGALRIGAVALARSFADHPVGSASTPTIEPIATLVLRTWSLGVSFAAPVLAGLLLLDAAAAWATRLSGEAHPFAERSMRSWLGLAAVVVSLPWLAEASSQVARELMATTGT